jgi:CHASE2 domain-containing sensor protein
MTNKKSGCSVSLPFITLILVSLKLTGVINWSWLWVTSPIWIPIALALLILFIASGVVLILFAVGVDKEKIKEGLNKLKK